FSIITEVKMQHIPYKGTGPAIIELLAGEVQLFFTPPAPVIPHVTNGRLKAIAVSSDSRLSVLPHVETFAEAGVPGVDVRTWLGILAPAGTPNPIVKRISSEIARIVGMA